jgi:hypothetical protein
MPTPPDSLPPGAIAGIVLVGVVAAAVFAWAWTWGTKLHRHIVITRPAQPQPAEDA